MGEAKSKGDSPLFAVIAILYFFTNYYILYYIHLYVTYYLY